jgi:hypothetical protein
MPVLRRVRGVVSIAVVWGAAVAVIGTTFIVAGLAGGWIPHNPATSWMQWLSLASKVAARNFGLGVAAGSAFALLLAGAERRRRVENLSLPRVCVWGFLASAVPTAAAAIASGASMPLFTFAAGTIAAGLVGLGLGAGIVALARIQCLVTKRRGSADGMIR